MNGSNPFSYNNRNPFCNDFFAHREGFGVRIYNTPTSTVPNTPRMPQGSIVAPSTIGDVTRNAATNILVNLVVGGAFRLARGAFAQKGTAAVASSSMVQNTFAVWLGNVGMLAGKLPKKGCF